MNGLSGYQKTRIALVITAMVGAARVPTLDAMGSIAAYWSIGRVLALVAA